MEVWKDIVGYEGMYQVSSLGNIRSMKNNKIRLLQPGINTGGYKQVTLLMNGVPKSARVHRIVASAFIQKTDKQTEVNHINGVKTDNRVENLEWVSRETNMQHAYDFGLKKKMYGAKNGSAKLNEKRVAEIRKLFRSGKYTKLKLGEIFHVTDATIGNIVRNETWKHVN